MAFLFSRNEEEKARVISNGSSDSVIYRCPLVSGDSLRSNLYPDIPTLYHVWERSSRVFADRPCLGTRLRTEQGRVGPYQWLTYSTVYRHALNLGSGFRALGVQSQEAIGIYSQNNAENMITDTACMTQDFIAVPLYDTYGANAAEFIARHARTRIVVCSLEHLEAVASWASRCPDLRHVVVMASVTQPPSTSPLTVPAVQASLAPYLRTGLGEPEDGSDSEESATVDRRAWPRERAGSLAVEGGPDIHLWDFHQILELGEGVAIPPHPPSPEGIASLIYTSGTTGQPKGVICTHSNYMASIAGVYHNGGRFTTADVHISFLPLAHCLERGGDYCLIMFGAQIGFFQGSMDKLAEDLQALRPTIFGGPPRLFIKLREMVLKELQKMPFYRRWIFFASVRRKMARLEQGLDTPILDHVVFSKVRIRTGGRVRRMMSVAAPLSPELQRWTEAVFGCPVIQGYGLTETMAAVASQLIRSPASLGNVGVPVACIEVRLESVPEMGYDAHDPIEPKGELCVRGPNVFQGYWENPELTREVIDSDGWFHTGDIACIDGPIRIIDRKKCIFKLSQGEYVAPEYLETVFEGTPWVEQCFVYGDSFRSCLVGVCIVSLPMAQDWAQQHHRGSAPEDLRKCPELRAHVLEQTQAEGRRAKLSGFQLLRAIRIEFGEWTEAQGFLTPTLKLKRAALTKHYREALDALYEEVLGEEHKALRVSTESE